MHRISTRQIKGTSLGFMFCVCIYTCNCEMSECIPTSFYSRMHGDTRFEWNGCVATAVFPLSMQFMQKCNIQKVPLQLTLTLQWTTIEGRSILYNREQFRYGVVLRICRGLTITMFVRFSTSIIYPLSLNPFLIFLGYWSWPRSQAYIPAVEPVNAAKMDPMAIYPVAPSLMSLKTTHKLMGLYKEVLILDVILQYMVCFP